MKRKTEQERLFEVMARLDKTFKPKLNENYSDYLDTHYSADGMEDYHADNATQTKAEVLYDKGLELFNAGDVDGAEKLRQEALRISSSLGWDENELPPYGDNSVGGIKEALSGGSVDSRMVGFNIYKDVIKLINNQAGDEIWERGAEHALKFYEDVINALRDALYQDMGDSVNKNAGAAPDEIKEDMSDFSTPLEPGEEPEECPSCGHKHNPKDRYDDGSGWDRCPKCGGN